VQKTPAAATARDRPPAPEKNSTKQPRGSGLCWLWSVLGGLVGSAGGLLSGLLSGSAGGLLTVSQPLFSPRSVFPTPAPTEEVEVKSGGGGRVGVLST